MLPPLLRDDGVIFVSIDDHEVHNLRLLMDEIFGEENFLAQFVWKCRQFIDARAKTHISTDHEYVLSYSRSQEASFKESSRDENKYANPDNDPNGPWMSRSILGLATAEQRPNLHYDISNPETGISYSPPANTGWRYSKERMNSLIADKKIIFPKTADGRPREKKFRSEIKNDYISFPTIIDEIFTAEGTEELRTLFQNQVFDFPKPSKLIQQMVEQITDYDEIILD